MTKNADDAATSASRPGRDRLGRRTILTGGVGGAIALSGVRSASATAAEPAPLRAAVLEHVDQWTNSVGLAVLLRRAGFTVVPLDPARPATEQGDVDLIAFGGFTNNAPAYGSFISDHAGSIGSFVASGGVLLDMAQSDQFNSTVGYLPAPLAATRNDSDYDTIYPLADDHPLVSHLRVVDGRVFTGRSTQIRVSWESLLDWRRMRVLLACQAAGRPPALLEGAHGQGRFLVTSLTIDKCYRADQTSTIQPADAIADSEMFFSALASYVRSVREGTAPEVVPTLQPIAGPLVGDTGTHHARILARPGSDLHDRQAWACTFGTERGPRRTVEARLSEANDFTVLFSLTGLRPDTAYTYEIEPVGDPIPGFDLTGSFTTATPEARPTTLVMGLGSCVWTEANPIWDRIRSEGCESFVMLGDTPYIDSTNLGVARQKQRAFLEHPDVNALTRSMPVWATWDDHDFGGNDVHGDLAGKRNNRTAFVDYRANATFGHDTSGAQLTERTVAGEGIYTSFRRGPIEVFVLDPRWFSRTEPSWADPAKPTCLGRVQWEWLQEKLLASTAPFKCLATGMIWDDKQNAESDDWGYYSHERDAIFDFLAEHRIPGVFLVGGDIHVSRALNYGPRVGYDLWQFIVSPMHSSTIPSLNVPHPSLVHSAVEPHVFLRLEADTTVRPHTLRATWVNRDGERVFEVETDSERLSPLPAWVTFDSAETELVPGEAGTVSTTFTNNTDRPLQHVSMALAAPTGWTVLASSPASFASVPPGDTATTQWSVTVPEGTVPESYSLEVSARYAGGRVAPEAETLVRVLPAAVIPRTRLSIAGVSSEQAPADAATKAIDGDPATFWHSRWATTPVPGFPHWIALDLGGDHEVAGLSYLPRQAGTNGRIKDYEIFLSEDGQAWGDPVAAGSFTIGAEATLVAFATRGARFLKLVGLSSQNGLRFGGAAEITVYGDPA